jgi:hypothetical protein
VKIPIEDRMILESRIEATKIHAGYPFEGVSWKEIRPILNKILAEEKASEHEKNKAVIQKKLYPSKVTDHIQQMYDIASQNELQMQQLGMVGNPGYWQPQQPDPSFYTVQHYEQAIANLNAQLGSANAAQQATMNAYIQGMQNEMKDLAILQSRPPEVSKVGPVYSGNMSGKKIGYTKSRGPK